MSVHHMDETTGITMDDSTSNNKDGTKVSATDPNPITGQVDGAQDFAGDNDYIISTNSGAALTQLTVSFWAYPDQTVSGQKGLFQWASSLSSGAPFILIARESNTTDLKFYVDGNYRLDSPINNLSYSYVTLTLNSSNLWTFYINGVFKGSYQDDATHGNQASSASVYYGNGYSGYFDGKMDEGRISNIFRSSDWVEAEYLTTTDAMNTHSNEEYFTPNIPPITSEITASAWINPTTLGATRRSIITRGDDGSQDWYIQTSASSAGKVEFSADGTNSSTSTTTLAINTWYHLTMTAGGGKTKLFINGTLDTETDFSGTIGTTGDISIGNDPSGGTGFIGKIDETRLYNKTLSDAQVKTLYETPPGPLAYWDFDAGSGIVVLDQSTNGRDGEWNGTGTHWNHGKFGKAGQFNGSDDYVSVSNAIAGVQTVSFWVKPLSTTTSLLDLDGSNYITVSSGTISAAGFDTPTIYVDGNATTTLVADQWQHVTVKTATAISASAVTLGKANSAYLSGLLDEVKFYNYERTGQQITSDLNAGHPVPGSPIGSSVVHLRFDEGYGDTAYDSTPNGHNADLGGSGVSCPGVSTCSYNSALGVNGMSMMFAGSSATRMDVPSSTDFDAPQQTWSFWLYTDGNWDTADGGEYDVAAIVGRGDTTGSRNGVVLSMGRAGTASIYSKMVSVNVFDNTGYVGDITKSPIEVADNKWHHVAVTLDQAAGGETKIYIDGELGDTDTHAGSWNFNNQNIRFGDAQDAWFEEYSGRIDEFKIYSSILTADQILMDYNQGMSAMLGSINIDSDGTTSTSSYAREMCVPGDTSTCGAMVEWPFEERTGTYAYDHSSGEISGRLGGDGAGTDLPTWTKGKVGNALNFDGDDDYVLLANNSGTSPGAGNLTVSAWIRPSALTSQEQWIYSDYGSVTNNIVLLRIYSDNRIQAFFRDASGDTGNPYATTLPVANTWYHLSAVRNGTTVYLYVNGKLENSVTVAGLGTITTSDGPAPAIGANSGDVSLSNFNGIIDQVRVYQYARSAAQVAWEYNRGAPISHWRLDECSGNQAHDSGPNNITGTITIGATVPNSSLGTCSSGTSTEAWNNGTTGKRNSSIDLDGVDDYIDLGDDSKLSFTRSDSQFTIAAWIKLDSGASGNPVILGKYDSQNDEVEYTFHIDPATNELEFWASENGTADTNNLWKTSTADNVIITDTWQHVAVMVNISTDIVQFYVNGIEKTATEDQLTGITDIPNLTEPARIGAFRCGTGNLCNFFPGQIDDVRVYNYALTNHQIKTEYNSGTIYFGPSEGLPD
ncbi:MAG: hypothetical protein UU80_C0036G0003 [candidate division WWE3 bacterium GW2011_GWA1_41_8]|uniref:LamG-like jellyroll fold domain-containing protein n=1 Tax=candidate division WWE3 bacterium GW2011_GWA1_41_8 TaxID=1619103 RepID=A0A0G0ZG44_UNCKA|nr:MAG: hypothetical protein UU80_C0036G0003 [candidate division WWE3 bacterium GW2011_GWA1_41_8]